MMVKRDLTASMAGCHRARSLIGKRGEIDRGETNARACSYPKRQVLVCTFCRCCAPLLSSAPRSSAEREEALRRLSPTTLCREEETADQNILTREKRTRGKRMDEKQVRKEGNGRKVAKRATRE